MRKVGILGGTFNPPHIGHLIMANEAFHSLALDEVRFMPNSIAPHKAVNDVSADQRAHMTKLAIESHSQFRIEEHELKKTGVSFTFETMRELVELEQDTEFYFIIGGDMIEGLDEWHRIDDLVRLVNFVGIGRAGFSSSTRHPIILVDSPEIHLSSTILRERAADGRPLTFFVPEKVEAFIREERLYGSEPDASKSE
ncbi:MAG TPA: nicotinate-nucleotide adenylyltransferase, partial [Planococcus sp. (in: firmicutes)]|nr:nicotinate-nucleotide adenylyltransferase [Planococcus sp. (in: firmicutes)]